MAASVAFTYPREFTAEDIRYLEETPLEFTIPEPLSDPQAIRIHSYPRIWRKARKCQDCGRVCFMLRDDAGHLWRQGFHCNLRFCTNCAIVRAEKMLDGHSHVLRETLAVHPEAEKFRFVRAFLVFPAHVTREHLESFQESIKRGIKALSPLASFDQTYLWPEKRAIESRMLLLGEYDISLLLAAFPGMTIRAITCPIGQWQQYIRELISADVPRTPEARGDAEYLADGIRLFRATGAFYGQGSPDEDQDTLESESQVGAESYDLVTEELNTTVNKSPHMHLSRCPQCDKKAVEISNTYSLGDPAPDPATLRWHSVG